MITPSGTFSNLDDFNNELEKNIQRNTQSQEGAISRNDQQSQTINALIEKNGSLLEGISNPLGLEIGVRPEILTF